MSVKDQALAIIQRLPDDAEIRDIEEELALLRAVHVADDDIAQGRLIDNETMKDRISQWTSN